jgi:DNA modification methylase
VGGEVCSILGTLYTGDALTVLKTLPDESVQCCVTSPPYWGLRDYGTATWEGGDAGCEHLPPKDIHAAAVIPSRLGGGKATQEDAERSRSSYRTLCGRCGARRIDAQLGLEPTPEAHVAKMVEVFREVKRVLRRDGTLWLNIGDSYAGSQQAGGSGKETLAGGKRYQQETMHNHRRGLAGLKPKDLVGIPWMLAFALRADGWWLRSDIIWAKPNPMPESVTDRPTKSHEDIFLLSKAATYYYDQEATREPLAPCSIERFNSGAPMNRTITAEDLGVKELTGAMRGAGKYMLNPAGRNLRSVWNIATQPFKGAHFATFPQKLAETCIKAGTSERGCCPTCGGPWERVVERDIVGYSPSPRSNGNKDRNDSQDGRTERSSSTLGWRPTCSCGETDTRPCLVLDPFSGAGTTGLVATKLGRDYIGIELNPAYNAMAKGRIENMLVTVNVACVGH